MMVSVERRARVHAALAEPVRLAIVDHLVLGDASPSELGGRFGLASNLLAHHLRVLEEAGVIRRTRSEGDRRRSYVQLSLSNPIVRGAAVGGDSGTGALSRANRLVFVCTANSARSQLAAAGWNRLSALPATSAGTHPAARIHPRTVSVGRRHSLPMARAKISRLDDVVTDDDVIIAVCDNAYEELSPERISLHWAIADPVRADTDEAFEIAYQDITRRVERLADAVVPS